MKTTPYFEAMKTRADRAAIKEEWIERTVGTPAHERIQADGRIRRWKRIDDAGGKWLRVVPLPDGETVHNAFFDRGFEP